MIVCRLEKRLYSTEGCVDLLLSYGADVNVSMGVNIYNNMN